MAQFKVGDEISTIQGDTVVTYVRDTPSQCVYETPIGVFDESEVEAIDVDEDGEEYDDYEDDGQPTMYEEYQDLHGGDDWDYGQCDEY
jgi:hypothetical protein